MLVWVANFTLHAYVVAIEKKLIKTLHKESKNDN
jgi:hypothetical protein